MRKYLRSLSLLLTLCLTPTLAFCQGSSEGPKFVEGLHYSLVKTPKDVSAITGILVEEAFGYWCPHCAQFDPLVNAWSAKLPADVVFQRLPVTFGQPANRIYSQAYYTALDLKLLDKVHPAIFNALHQERRRITSVSMMAELFTDASGMLPDLVHSTLDSASVKARVEAADRQVLDYGLSGVPSLIVGGKYKVAASQANGLSPQGMLDCVDFVVAKLRAEAANTAKAP